MTMILVFTDRRVCSVGTFDVMAIRLSNKPLLVFKGGCNLVAVYIFGRRIIYKGGI